jgi:hypothetical protein
MKILSIISLLSTCTIYAQVGHIDTLNFNNISTIIGDEGVFFKNSSTGVAAYEVPKGSGKKTIYSASIWMGAEDVNGLVHVSGLQYDTQVQQSRFQSGPIAHQMNYTALNYTAQYGKSIWKVSQQEVENHIQNYNQPGYSTPTSISDWPGNGDVSLGVASQLAPYIDVNNDGFYTPPDGDYPDIRGSQAVYVILNDQSYISGVNPLGVEVHLMFYQYHNGTYLSNTTFLNVRTINRSTSDYYNYRQLLYFDFDIGNFDDDYIGCDSSNHVIFGYNGDHYDDISGSNGTIGYGFDPPCQGVVSLSHKLHTFSYYTNGSAYPYADPVGDTAMWNIMNAQWSDGTPYLDPNGNPTNFNLNGNPYTNTGWTEFTQGNPVGDRRGVMTIAEDELPIGSTICADYAIIYDRSNDGLRNVQNVINIAATLRYLYEEGVGFPCHSSSFTALTENAASDFKIYPNPSNGDIVISFDHIPSESTISITDLSGRIIYSTAVDGQAMKVHLDEASGIYLVSLHTKNGIHVKKLMID